MVRASKELSFTKCFVLDSLIAELQRHYSKKNCEIMQGVQSLNPKRTTFVNEAPLFAFAQIFESDLEDLKHEVHQTKRLLDRRMKSGRDRLSTLLDFAVFLEPYKEVFHELFRLCKIYVVTPVKIKSNQMLLVTCAEYNRYNSILTYSKMLTSP
jgi:glycyl-tRNA synthetase alpha subunit